MSRLFAVLCAATFTAPAAAESLIADYFSLLGPADAYNSRGVPLDDLCAIARQDRANWHRFGIREQADGPDFFFASAENRAQMTGRCVYDANYYANPGIRIRNGSRAFYVYVRVFGVGGTVTRVVIAEGAG